jgi:tRNA nucleotidyltransferase/poly(A) polymerase
MKLTELVENLKSKKFIKSLINDLKGEVFVVGGSVRDLILNKQNKDIDLVVRNIKIDDLINHLSNFGKVDVVGKSFGVIKLKSNEDGLDYDLALPRTEKPNGTGGYQGFDITSDHELSIEQDLLRRDAKINAMAVNLNTGKFIDPTGGLNDIKNKQMSMANPESFKDDPLRMLRIIGFSSRFGFNVEPQTMHEIRKSASKIREISPERILIEFDKIIKKGSPLIGAKLLRQTGLYDQIFGVSRGINLADFNNVRTMGEFIYELIKGANQNPAEFFKNNLKGDLDTYNEIKALQLGGQFKGDKKTIFDMYKTYPKSLNTTIFGQDFMNAVTYMKDHNIPFSLKEVPVSGNDLIELGYQGKEIGNMFVEILSKIYKEELSNEREAILGYVKSKKSVNESLYSINSDDYRSIDDSTLEKQINIVIGFKIRSDDGKAIYIPHEDLFEVYGYAYIAIRNNSKRVEAMLNKYASTLQAKYHENMQLIGSKLKEIGLLK